jgi:hypothetical protein
MDGKKVGKIAGYLGTTVGILGWLIGFSIFCLTTGMMDLLARVFIPGLVISLLMAGIVVLMMELIVQRFGFAPFFLQLSLWAMLTSVLGLLWFILNHWLGPLISRHPQAAEKLTEMGSVYQTSDKAPVTLMGMGVVLLLILIISVFKQNRNR